MRIGLYKLLRLTALECVLSMTDQERTLMLGLVKSFQESLKEGRWDDVDPTHIMKCASLCLDYEGEIQPDGSNPTLDKALVNAFGTTGVYTRDRPMYLRNIGEDFLDYLSDVMDVEVEKIK